MLSRREIGAFIGELGRRRVFRVAAWYAAAAWAVIELTTTIFPIIGIGDPADLIVLIVVIVAGPITFALAWIFDITPYGVERTGPRAGATAVAESRTQQVIPTGRSIVVLPFRELSGSDSDYFADGVTDDIIAALAGVRDVRVISRTSAMQYRRTEKSLPQIAAELGVAYVLEGSIRRAGDRVRIIAQLVDASSDVHVWAETYDRQIEDIFAIQSEVARRITQSLEAELSTAERARLDRRPTRHLDAYDAYLRGRHLWNQRTEPAIRQGIVSLKAALATDPEFAIAWAALAEAYVTLALYGVAAPGEVLPLARDAAQRALTLDAELVEARSPIAAVRLHYDWDWNGADTEYRRITDGDTRYATAHHWYANYLAAAGRFDDARAALGRARLLDPLSPAILTSAGIISYFERDHTRARAELDDVTARYPSFPLARLFVGLVHLAGAHESDATAQLRVAVEMSGRSAEARAALACCLATFGQDVEARELLHGFASEPYVSPVLHAYVHAALGEHEAALRHIANAVQLRAADLVWLAVRPAADPLRTLPEFQSLIEPVFTSRRLEPAGTRERHRSRG